MSDARRPESCAGQLFISYRRDDSAGYARALNDRLTLELGGERVFIDVDDKVTEVYGPKKHGAAFATAASAA